LVNRLSADEYANAVRDLFDVDVRSEAELLPDGLPTAREFNNQSSTVTREHADRFAAIARTVSSSIDPQGLLADYADGCDSYDAACTGVLIENLGRAVLRGPLGEVERAPLERVLSTAAAQAVEFDEAVRYLVQALLQAPRFMYRIEAEIGDGTVRELNDFELASRLSFAIWGSTPDAELLDLAAAGQLADVHQAQVTRMLADPRAEQQALEFFDDWMDLHRLADASQIHERYPDFDEALLEDMREETHAAFNHIYDNGLPLQAIHNLQTTVITGRLAEHYGLPNQGDGEYDLSALPERGGLLTQGSMASLGGAESSTVRLGLHVFGEILCGEIPPPPDGLATVATPAAPGVSVRQSSEVRVDNAVCGGCHRHFEPLIWGLTRYDVAGNYAPVDEFGNELPEDGWVVFPDEPSTEHPYASVSELMNLLASSSRVRDCATLQYRRFVTRQDALAGDRCSLSIARQELEQGSGTYQEIVEALALSPNFSRVTTELSGGAQ
jgi:hypothetical protein